jgi:glycosyltransferase involved in cell wall biosynthesis
MLEPVPHHEMPKVIRDADLSAYTPLPDVHMNIAMSLKIPEVIAVGRPMVTSRLAVLQEYFGDDCLFIFKPGDIDDCAAKILEVYTQPAKVTARVMRAQKTLMKYSWEKQLAVYLEIIQSIMNGK